MSTLTQLLSDNPDKLFKAIKGDDTYKFNSVNKAGNAIMELDGQFETHDMSEDAWTLYADSKIALMHFRKEPGFETADYKLVRRGIQEFMATANWIDLDPHCKELAAEYFAVDGLKQWEVYGDLDVIFMKGIEFHRLSSECRMFRSQAIEALVYAHFDLGAAYQIVKQVKAPTEAYVKYGLEGVASGDPEEGLYDYFLSTTGSMYDTAGWLECGLQSKTGATLAEIRDAIVYTLTYGV